MNGYGKLRRCTERDAAIVDFYLYLAPDQRKRTLCARNTGRPNQAGRRLVRYGMRDQQHDP